MSRQKKTDLVPVTPESLEFDYGPMKPAQAEKLRTTAKGIRDKINKSLRGLIEAGQGLLVSEAARKGATLAAPSAPGRHMVMAVMAHMAA
jgi:hypothetical protein